MCSWVHDVSGNNEISCYAWKPLCALTTGKVNISIRIIEINQEPTLRTVPSCFKSLNSSDLGSGIPVAMQKGLNSTPEFSSTGSTKFSIWGERSAEPVEDIWCFKVRLQKRTLKRQHQTRFRYTVSIGSVSVWFSLCSWIYARVTLIKAGTARSV